MDKTILVGLGGRPDRYRLAPDAYDRLQRYLDRSASRLHDDPDRDEVLGDLERSLGDKLAARLGTDDRLVTATDIDSILEEIGAVDTGRDPGAYEDGGRSRPRKLHRVREGQQIAGVCSGIADYAEVGVDWVRTVFILAALFTAGLFTVVYIALVFLMPVVPAAPSSR